MAGEVDGLLEVELEGVGGEQTPAIGADDGVALRLFHIQIRTLENLAGTVLAAGLERLSQRLTKVLRHFDWNISGWGCGREFIR